MLKILMGPNVKILMGQSFGSWTHGHGPMALGAWAAAGQVCGTRGEGGGGAAAAHKYFDMRYHVSRSQSFGP